MSHRNDENEYDIFMSGEHAQTGDADTNIKWEFYKKLTFVVSGMNILKEE